jgi:hypothetical protein
MRMNANYYWGIKGNMGYIRSALVEENHPLLIEYLNDELYPHADVMFDDILTSVLNAESDNNTQDKFLFGEFCGNAMCLEIFSSKSIVSFSVGNLQEEQIDTRLLSQYLNEFAKFINFPN